MCWPFVDAFRRQVAGRCAAFSRIARPDGSAGLKPAAVAITLVPLVGEPGPAATGCLLTRRAKGLRGHGGQWALPGGRCEAREMSAQTALRELAEEVGLGLGEDAVLGLLDDYPTRSGYLITPVVLWAAPAQELRPDPREVASVHRIALATVERADAFDFVAIPESTRRVIRFHHRSTLIHAPTAALVYQFREVLAGRHTRVTELEQPVFAWK